MKRRASLQEYGSAGSIISAGVAVGGTTVATGLAVKLKNHRVSRALSHLFFGKSGGHGGTPPVF